MPPSSELSRLKTDATTRMKAAGIPNADHDALILLQHVTGSTAARIHTGDVPVSGKEAAQFMKLVDRRISREPLQYILGTWPFWKHAFTVTPDVLIPRPETEHILEVLLEKTTHNTTGLLVDCCTGSGCLAISAASERPRLSIIGTDISPKALNIAETNRRNLKCRPVHWACSDMLAAFPHDCADVIIANPPYVSQSDSTGLEPELAGSLWKLKLKETDNNFFEIEIEEHQDDGSGEV